MDKKYEDLLRYVERPARYIGGEINACIKDWRSAELKVALVFPDIYEIGMSHLGIKVLYHLLNSRSGILCERVFAPWADMERLLRAENLPIFTLESNRPLSEFDIIGFSLAHELNYTNALNILDLAGIPLMRRERDRAYPLIIAGGPCVFNPEPMSDFMDIFLIGDGEDAILEIAERCILSKRRGDLKNRSIFFRELSGIEGVYIPGLYEPSYKGGRFEKLAAIEDYAPAVVRKRTSKNLDGCFYPVQQIVPYIPVVHDRVSLEIMRGCPHKCRFCQAAAIYSPLRLRSEDALFGLAKSTQALTGYDELSLLSLSTGDYPGIAAFLERLTGEFAPQGVNVSLPSLRIEDNIKDLPPIIKKTKKSGLTFAPEVGSERLRRFVNKNIDPVKLLDAVKAACGLGWRRIKLYFMVGFPGETEEDIDAITKLCDGILYTRSGGKKISPEITMSVSSFIPKPHTVFQWDAMAPKEALQGKILRLKRGVKSPKIKLNAHNIEMSVLEAALSRGDRRAGSLIETAHRNGARFDSWKDIFSWEIWKKAADECGVDIAAYLGGMEYDSPLPWDHIIITGRDKEFLAKESMSAHEGAGIIKRASLSAFAEDRGC